MGDKEQRAFQLSFNGFLKVDFQGSRVTSDGGLLLVRELDERLGLGKLIDEHLTDSSQGSNKKFRLADLVRQSVYSRLAGYEDLNDAVRVSARGISTGSCSARCSTASRRCLCREGDAVSVGAAGAESCREARSERCRQSGR